MESEMPKYLELTEIDRAVHDLADQSPGAYLARDGIAIISRSGTTIITSGDWRQFIKDTPASVAVDLNRLIDQVAALAAKKS